MYTRTLTLSQWCQLVASSAALDSQHPPEMGCLGCLGITSLMVSEIFLTLMIANFFFKWGRTGLKWGRTGLKWGRSGLGFDLIGPYTSWPTS